MCYVFSGTLDSILVGDDVYFLIFFFTRESDPFFMFSVGAIRGNTQRRCLRRFGGTIYIHKSMYGGGGGECVLFFFLDPFSHNNEAVDE